MPIVIPHKTDTAKWIPIVVSIGLIIAGWGGFYALTDWRLSQNEKNMEKFEERISKIETDQEQTQRINTIYVELAKIHANLEDVINRTDDDAIEDWNRWRATKDAQIDGLRRDFNMMYSEVYGP